jgi:hypothetical protein
MSTEGEKPKPKTSIEERVKSNVALWFLGAVAAGFSAGIGAVKWSDERYKVEPIPIAERDAFVKAQSDLVALRKDYQDLEGRNAQLKATLAKQGVTLESQHPTSVGAPVPVACGSQRSELDSLRVSYAKSQADLIAARESCSAAPAVSATAVRPSELSQISLVLSYAPRRFADANLIANRLGPQFRELQLVVCPGGCSRTAQIHYGYDLSAPVAFSVAKLLTQAGVAEFSQPMITQGDAPHRMTVYLAD